MGIQVCPTEVVEASPERVWSLLIDAEAMATWSRMRVLAAPARHLVVGDRVVLVGGRGLKLVFAVRQTEPLTRFAVEVSLPFGVVNQEVIEIRALAGGRSRVTFRCDFGFPSGWRGVLLERLLRRQLSSGAEQLALLKSAAEMPGTQRVAPATHGGQSSLGAR
jgi:hypothetical protein